jgi:hypothetical protein
MIACACARSRRSTAPCASTCDSSSASRAAAALRPRSAYTPAATTQQGQTWHIDNCDRPETARNGRPRPGRCTHVQARRSLLHQPLRLPADATLVELPDEARHRRCARINEVFGAHRVVHVARG